MYLLRDTQRLYWQTGEWLQMDTGAIFSDHGWLRVYMTSDFDLPDPSDMIRARGDVVLTRDEALALVAACRARLALGGG